jgi:predicted Zn-dependent peptidase
VCALLLYGTVVCFSAQDFSDFAKKVTEFNLPNGLHFILAERHEAPVVSFHTYIKAGSANDPSGQTGLAHMFEHMAFKGTETIGSRDWPSEKKALDAIEEAYDRLEAERNKGPNADRQRLFSLETQVKNAADRAQAFVAPNEYTSVIEGAGGVGLNAGTSWDSTEYYYSLPSNRIELWFLMESQRFLQPVFREFYKERDVVAEENRMRVQSSPQGKLLQQYTATTFEAHPYRNPPGGWPSDVADLRRSEAKAFFDTYYVPSNMVIAIVGDVNPAEARRMAERYFGPMQARPLPPVLHTQEQPQAGPRTAVVESASQPALVVGYKRPDNFQKDDAVFDVIQLILSSGRTGWLYRDLVQEKRLAVAAQASGTYPSGRYPCTFIFLIAPAQGHTVEENTRELDEILKRLQTQKVDAVTLNRARTRARAEVVRRLANNEGLAALLSSSYGMYGDWRKLFTATDDINKVTAEDVERVARQYFTAANRTTAWLAQTAQAPGAAKPAGGRQ